MMLFLVRKVLGLLMEFSNIDDVASYIAQQDMIIVTERLVAKTL